jgi:hypothetical protein
MRGQDRENDYHGWAMDLASQSNAFFNQFWMVVSNHCEKEVYSQKLDYYGGSQIVDPLGKVVAYLKDEEGLVTHRADVQDAVLKSRTEAFFGLNLLQDRRPELYGYVLDQSHRYPNEALTTLRATPPSHQGGADRRPRLAKVAPTQ